MATNKNKLVTNLNRFAILQMTVGIGIGCLSVVAICLDTTDFDRFDRVGKDNIKYIILGLDITCLLSSFWFVHIGILPFLCYSRITVDKTPDWIKTKSRFMVCNIIAASVLVPVVFVSAIATYVMRGNYSKHLTALSAMLGVFALLELILAIVASVYCCCYSAWGPCQLEREDEIDNSKWKKYMKKRKRCRKNKKDNSEDGETDKKEEKGDDADQVNKEKTDEDNEVKSDDPPAYSP